MEDGRTTVEQAKRAEIYKKAQQIMFDECPVLPIAHSVVISPAVKKVQNFMLHPTNSVRMKSVWLQ
jgi:peptide/nickel transport system substrate-binding protein